MSTFASETTTGHGVWLMSCSDCTQVKFWPLRLPPAAGTGSHPGCIDSRWNSLLDTGRVHPACCRGARACQPRRDPQRPQHRGSRQLGTAATGPWTHSTQTDQSRGAGVHPGCSGPRERRGTGRGCGELAGLRPSVQGCGAMQVCVLTGTKLHDSEKLPKP